MFKSLTVFQSHKTFSFCVFSFGESNVTTTTQRLPIEALGDRDLVDRLSKLPKDKQPFWLLNWHALEEQRKNPQTYPQRPSHFSQPLNGPGFTSGNQFNSGTSGFASGNTNANNDNFGSTNSDSANFGIIPLGGGEAPLNNNPINVIPDRTTGGGFDNRFGNDDTTLRAPGHVVTPTYPIYAHVDDVLGNNYVPSQISQSGSYKSDSGPKHTASSNKPSNRNVAKANRKLAFEDTANYEDTGFFYAPQYWANVD